MIELPQDIDLLKLVKEAYDLSALQGLGFLHFKEGSLSDEEAKAIVDRSANDRMCAVSMDYVNGRAVKFHISRRDGKLLVDDSWFDHSDSQYAELRKRCGF